MLRGSSVGVDLLLIPCVFSPLLPIACYSISPMVNPRQLSYQDTRSAYQKNVKVVIIFTLNGVVLALTCDIVMEKPTCMDAFPNSKSPLTCIFPNMFHDFPIQIFRFIAVFTVFPYFEWFPYHVPIIFPLKKSVDKGKIPRSLPWIAGLHRHRRWHRRAASVPWTKGDVVNIWWFQS